MSSDITKLPKELLALIFEHLTKPNDRRRAAQACKLFYEVIRHQSTLKRDNMLRMKASDSDKSPIRVFEKSAFFPFSKLDVVDWHLNVVMESAFWTLYGKQINKIIFNDTDVHKGNVLLILKEYFPNLKQLEIIQSFSQSPDAKNYEDISLPIEDLSIDRRIPLDQVLTLFRCSPLLKNLEMQHINADYLPQILPWLETIESSRLTSNEMWLEKLIYLPSKVIISELIIKGGEAPKTIREFFKHRTIETLILCSKVRNEGFHGHGEENVDNPMPIYFNRDQALALGAAKSIKNIDLPYGVLEFEGSLDLLSQLPGLESISLNFFENIPSPLNPFYWSLPGTAQKIRSIYQNHVSNLDNLVGLSSVTSYTNFDFDENYEFSNVEIQTLIRHFPNLEELKLPTIVATSADLIGQGDLLPISSLEKLEYLDIDDAPNITSEAFKGAFKFPNLKEFTLGNYNSSEEEPFNQDVAKHFTQNCPNLEFLTIFNCHITEEGFDYLIRHLPYLQSITIGTDCGHSLSKDKVEELKQEFPYITITVRELIRVATSE